MLLLFHEFFARFWYRERVFAYSLLPIDSLFARTLNSLGLKFANIHENKVLANISELSYASAQ